MPGTDQLGCGSREDPRFAEPRSQERHRRAGGGKDPGVSGRSDVSERLQGRAPGFYGGNLRGQTIGAGRSVPWVFKVAPGIGSREEAVEGVLAVGLFRAGISPTVGTREALTCIQGHGAMKPEGDPPCWKLIEGHSLQAWAVRPPWRPCRRKQRQMRWSIT